MSTPIFLTATVELTVPDPGMADTKVMARSQPGCWASGVGRRSGQGRTTRMRKVKRRVKGGPALAAGDPVASSPPCALYFAFFLRGSMDILVYVGG